MLYRRFQNLFIFCDHLEMGIRVRFYRSFWQRHPHRTRDALLAGSAKSDQRGLAFGLHRAGDTAGAFIGLAIATLIIWLTHQALLSLVGTHFKPLSGKYYSFHPGCHLSWLLCQRGGSCQEGK